MARGLKLGMDHGSQYLSDLFLNQIRSCGITASFAFVSEPESNGAVERFFRTLKEQAICGRILRNVEEVRAAVAKFVHDYHHRWRPEKLGIMTPAEHRRMHTQEAAA